MKTLTAPILIAVSLALGLSACSAEPMPDAGKTPDSAPVSSPAPSATPSPAADATPSPEPTKSTRGNLIKEVGELAGTISSHGDVVTSRFTVTDIILGHSCTSGYADTPANGHYLGIHLNVETTPELAAEPYPSMSFNEYQWQAYDADGKRLNDPVGNAWSCLDSGDQLPVDIGPGQSVSGWVVLDVAATTGIVVLGSYGGSTGWEWSY